MVGEVRDLETAEIAIRVALTGHLVFSTLHTNDAASGITRLVDIGVEPYLVSSSVEAFIAQRLIRLNCPDCKYEDTESPVELKRLISRDLAMRSPQDVKIFRGKGCAKCNFTGFFGRTAIYEAILIDEQMKDMILKKAPSSQIKKAAVSRGMRTLAQDGWQKVILGLTTPYEGIRVTAADEDKTSRYESAQASQEQSAVQGLDESDRRVYFRLDSSVNVRYTVFRSPEELTARGVKPEEFSITKNLSAGGILFISRESLAYGTILEMFIDLPQGQETIQCFAKVIRTDEVGKNNMYDIAVCFLDMTTAQRNRLDKCVKKQSP
jgi:hypothetical protein